MAQHFPRPLLPGSQRGRPRETERDRLCLLGPPGPDGGGRRGCRPIDVWARGHERLWRGPWAGPGRCSRRASALGHSAGRAAERRRRACGGTSRATRASGAGGTCSPPLAMVSRCEVRWGHHVRIVTHPPFGPSVGRIVDWGIASLGARTGVALCRALEVSLRSCTAAWLSKAAWAGRARAREFGGLAAGLRLIVARLEQIGLGTTTFSPQTSRRATLRLNRSRSVLAF